MENVKITTMKRWGKWFVRCEYGKEISIFSCSSLDEAKKQVTKMKAALKRI